MCVCVCVTKKLSRKGRKKGELNIIIEEKSGHTVTCIYNVHTFRLFTLKKKFFFFVFSLLVGDTLKKK